MIIDIGELSLLPAPRSPLSAPRSPLSAPRSLFHAPVRLTCILRYKSKHIHIANCDLLLDTEHLF